MIVVSDASRPTMRTVRVCWSAEDAVYVAEVPDLPGCMAHGDSEGAALANVRDAIQLWIDTAREFGDPIPEPWSCR